MNRVSSLLALGAFMLAACSGEQKSTQPDPPAQLEWRKLYATDGNFDGIGLSESTANGILIGGTSYVNDPNGDFFLMELNHDGDTLWAQTLPNDYPVLAVDMTATTDGHLMLAGMSRHGDGYRYSFAKTTKQGGIVWQRQAGDKPSSLRSISAAYDGGAFAVGTTTYRGKPNIYVVRVSALGDSLWTTEITSGLAPDSGFAVAGTPDGGCLVGGQTANTIVGKSGATIIRLSTNGEMLWQRAYGASQYGQVRAILQNVDGSFVAIGNTQLNPFGGTGLDVFFLSINESGEPQSHKTYPLSGDDYAVSLTSLSSGSYLVGGNSGGKIVLTALSTNGNILWQKFSANQNESLADAEVIDNNTIVILGKARDISGAPAMLVMSVTAAGNDQTLP